jgi:hypothetical protein
MQSGKTKTDAGHAQEEVEAAHYHKRPSAFAQSTRADGQGGRYPPLGRQGQHLTHSRMSHCIDIDAIHKATIQVHTY